MPCLSEVDNQTGSGQHKYSYMYDDVGNRTIMQVTDSGGTRNHVYSYDNIYQIKDVNYPPDYNYLATDTAFNYDLLGNRTTVVDGSGTTTYASNAMNQYTHVGGVELLYDHRGNTTYDGGNMYTYNAVNQLITATKVSSPLSAACHTILAFTTGGSANWFAQSNDANGPDNDAAQSGDIADSQSTWIETSVEGPGTIYFCWKLSSQEGDGVRFAIDSVNQTTRTSSFDWEERWFSVTGSGTHTLRWTYTKDASGSANDDSARLDYVRWTGDMPDPNGWETITYAYDSAGRRIEKAYDGQTVMKYLYDGDDLIAEYDGNGDLLHKYIYGPEVDEPICMIDVEHSSATYYYHFDGLGSVIALTNSSGSVVNLYEYSVYGETSASDPNHPNRFLFTGREFDADTGLYYYRARYYNPYVGRFLQTDPGGEGMNGYAYCDNDPIGYVDPSGLKQEWRLPQGKTKMEKWGKSKRPWATIPEYLIAAPVKPWNRSHFYWFYVHGKGDELNLLSTAGWGKGQLVPKIGEFVTDFIRTRARAKAESTWNEMASDYKRGKLTSYTRLASASRLVTDVDLSPILGTDGVLQMFANVVVRLNVNPSTKQMTGDASIYYNFILSGWFRDRYDIDKRGSRTSTPYWEFDGVVIDEQFYYVHPFPFRAKWQAYEMTINKNGSLPREWKWQWTTDWTEFVEF